MTLIQDIETPKPFTKNIPGETITAKYGSIDMFYTFQDDYIEWKHYVNDILSAICHNDDINSQNKINNLERKIKLLEIQLRKQKNKRR